MKRPARPKINLLVDGHTDQSNVVFFPENWRSTYAAYTALYSGDLLKSGRRRASALEVAKHTLLLLFWMGALTVFFAAQRSLVPGVHRVNERSGSIEAQISPVSKGPL